MKEETKEDKNSQKEKETSSDELTEEQLNHITGGQPAIIMLCANCGQNPCVCASV